MVKKLTVSEFLKELDISFPEFKNVLKECALRAREIDDEVTPLEKKHILEFLKDKSDNSSVSSLKPGQTKRRLLVHVQGARGRREAINVEVRKKRTYVKPVDTLNISETIEPAQSDKVVLDVKEAILAPETTASLDVNKPSAETVFEHPSLKKELQSCATATNAVLAAEDKQEHQSLAGKNEQLEPPELSEIMPLIVQDKNQAGNLVHQPDKGEREKETATKSSKKPRFNDKTNKASAYRTNLDLSSLEDLEGDEDSSTGILIASEHLRSKLVRNSGSSEKKAKRGLLTNNEGQGFAINKNKKAHKQSLQQKFMRPVTPVSKNIRVHQGITVQELAEKLSLKSTVLIKEMMKLGIIARLNDPVEADVIELISETLGHQISVVSSNELEEAFLSEQISESSTEKMCDRAPVVTVMGHVDHGKTSLLDFIRKTKVASGEAGGITQHLGAYQVLLPEGRVVFIDTPGHQAFTMMRARGARCTDIVVLVIASDDGVMPQTEEAIQHAKAAKVPIIVAITKSDKPSANFAKIKEELLRYELVCEEWGGETHVVAVSSVTGNGIDELLQSILLQASVLKLKAPISGPVNGVVLESKMDKGKGPCATVLIQKGLLKISDMVVCGQSYGRIKQITNELGQELKQAGPSTPVAIYGLTGLAMPGDILIAIDSEKRARELTEHRRVQARTTRLKEKQKNTQAAWGNLDLIKGGVESGAADSTEKMMMNIVIKADTNGTLEALKHALLSLNRDEVEICLRGYGVGAVTESDVALAQASQALLIAFNVRPDGSARKYIEQEQINLQYHGIIYEVIESVKAEISGRLSPIKREQLKGIAEVRAVFRSPKFGVVAGCLISEGLVTRKQSVRVIRDSKVIFEAELDSLRRGKEDVTEVRQGTECGIGLKNYSGFLIGDRIEVFDVTDVARNIFKE